MQQVHLLTHLRILTLRSLDNPSIALLHHLRSLHVYDELSADMTDRILDLSVEHKLRHLTFRPADLDRAIQRLRAGLAVGLLSVHVRGAPIQSALQFLISLPRVLLCRFAGAGDARLLCSEFPVSLSLRTVSIEPAWGAVSMGSDAFTKLSAHAPSLSSLQLPYSDDCDSALALFPNLTELDRRGPLTSSRLAALTTCTKVEQRNFRLHVEASGPLPPLTTDRMREVIQSREWNRLTLETVSDAVGQGEGSRTENETTQSFAVSAAEAATYLSMRANQGPSSNDLRTHVSLQRGNNAILCWSAWEYWQSEQ